MTNTAKKSRPKCALFGNI